MERIWGLKDEGSDTSICINTGKSDFESFSFEKGTFRLERGGGQVFCRFKLRKGMMIMVGFRIWNARNVFFN